MVPVVIKLWHQQYLFYQFAPRVTPRAMSSSVRHPTGQPFPEFNCFNVRLSVDKQTSASWHQDAGTKTMEFTTKRGVYHQTKTPNAGQLFQCQAQLINKPAPLGIKTGTVEFTTKRKLQTPVRQDTDFVQAQGLFGP